MKEQVVEKTKWTGTVERILTKNNHDRCALIAILQDAQREVGYLPKEVLEELAAGLKVPVSQVYSVATFYKAFKLNPSGKHIIKVCLGTACHIRGGNDLMRQLESELGVKEEQVTADKMFSFEAVRCVGCCGLAPVMMMDETFYGKIAPKQIQKILTQIKKQEGE